MLGQDDELDPKMAILNKLTGAAPGFAPGEPNPSAPGGVRLPPPGGLPVPPPGGQPVPPAGGLPPGPIPGPPSPKADDLPPPVPSPGPVNTNGYDAPKYTPTGNAGSAPRGYDQAKYADASHQSPKYAVARIMNEAAGGTGELSDPVKRQTAIDNVLKAYPGAKYNGKDKITFPDGGTVDVFEGAGAGRYGIAWQPETGPGGAPLPQEGGSATMPMGGSGKGIPQLGGGIPLDSLLTGGDASEAIQAALAQMVSGEKSNAQALLQRLMGGGRG